MQPLAQTGQEQQQINEVERQRQEKERVKEEVKEEELQSDLAVLHDDAKIAAKADLAVVSFVYLVLRGMDVVTQQQWHNALEDRSSLWRMSRLHHAEVRLSCKWSLLQ